MTAAQQSYPKTQLTSANRVSSRDRCEWCGSDTYCLRFESGDSFCRTVGEDSEWTDSFQGGYLHKAKNPQHQTYLSPVQSQRRADPDTLNSVYTALLAACPLSAEDRNYLASYQLTATEADYGFGTLPPKQQQHAIITKLVERFGYDVLKTVPGFTIDDGDLLLNGAGLLVAIRNVQGQIAGFQVRYGPGDYHWLSGGTGPSSGAPVHVAVPLTQDDNRIYVVESPKTATILASKLKAGVIGVAGHTNYAAALPSLEYLVEHECVVELVILFDQDANVETVEKVERNRQALALNAVQLGYAVRIGRWDNVQGKGPDDLLLNGGTFTREVYRPLLDAITAENKALRQQYEESERWRKFMVIMAANGWVAGDAETGQTIYTRVANGKRRPKPALTGTDRIIAICIALDTMRVPGVEYDDNLRYVKTSRERIADMAGVSVGAVSRSWQYLTAIGLFDKELVQKGRTDRETLFAAGQLPAAGALSRKRRSARNAV